MCYHDRLNVEVDRRIQLPSIKPNIKRTNKNVKQCHSFHEIFLTCWLVLENTAIFCFCFVTFKLYFVLDDMATQLQYSCLENPMDRGAWQTTIYRVAKS